jgi:hypothetical protein
MLRGWRPTSVVLGCLAVCVAAAALAQEGFVGLRELDVESDVDVSANTPYDGRFVFVRLRYGSGGGWGFGRGRSAGWSHDYPRADVHLMRIVKEITFVAPRVDGSNVLSLEDPELFDFPVAYMSEPGGWQATDAEVEGLRAYLAKGGFVIFDDFRGFDWENLQDQMRRVLPHSRFVALDASHPIFHSFFEIDSPGEFTPPYGGMPPMYFGIFEDNDPDKRLLTIANVNNDLGEYWEFSDTGLMPVDLSNEAYKFGVNYIVYAVTH